MKADVERKQQKWQTTAKHSSKMAENKVCKTAWRQKRLILKNF